MSFVLWLLFRLSFCKGTFTQRLINLWEDWEKDEENDCQNEHPGETDKNIFINRVSVRP